MPFLLKSKAASRTAPTAAVAERRFLAQATYLAECTLAESPTHRVSSLQTSLWCSKQQRKRAMKKACGTLYSKSNFGKLKKLRTPRLHALKRKESAGMEPHGTPNGLGQDEGQNKGQNQDTAKNLG